MRSPDNQIGLQLEIYCSLIVRPRLRKLAICGKKLEYMIFTFTGAGTRA